MEQFSLDKWLENPSRKIVTKKGNPVRIICTDRKRGEPIVFLEECSNREFILTCNKDGTSDYYFNSCYLFFADEDEELSEFEKHVQAVMMNCALVGHTNSYKDIDAVKATSKHLLDLARKELQSEFDKEMDKMLAETDKVVYQKGQQDVLKDLPKWKKNKLPNSESYMGVNGSYFCYRGYNINYDKLFEKLPKEE